MKLKSNALGITLALIATVQASYAETFTEGRIVNIMTGDGTEKMGEYNCSADLFRLTSSNSSGMDRGMLIGKWYTLQQYYLILREDGESDERAQRGALIVKEIGRKNCGL